MTTGSGTGFASPGSYTSGNITGSPDNSNDTDKTEAQPDPFGAAFGRAIMALIVEIEDCYSQSVAVHEVVAAHKRARERVQIERTLRRRMH